MTTVKQNPWVVQYIALKQSTGAHTWFDGTRSATKEAASAHLAKMVFLYPGTTWRIKNEFTGEII